MGRKNTLVTQIAHAQTLSSSFNSEPTVVRYMDNCSYQINIMTTDSTGTFSVQVSDDYYVNEGNDAVVTNPGNWATLTLSGTPTVAASNDTIVINLNQLPFYAVRLAYTSTIAGTGTADIFVTDKVIGA
jgi:hypothetical protein